MTDCTCTNFPSSLGFITFGNGLVADNDGVSNGVPDLRFGGTASGEGVGSTRATGGANQYGVDLYTNYTQRLSVTNGGAVGVGTTDPTVRLDVAVANGINDDSIRVITPNNDGGLRLHNTGTGGQEWYLDTTSGASGYGQGNLAFTLYAVSPPTLLLTASGNVGVGTTSPQQKLDVAGTVRTTGILLGGDMLLFGAIKDSTGQYTRLDQNGCYYTS